MLNKLFKFIKENKNVVSKRLEMSGLTMEDLMEDLNYPSLTDKELDAVIKNLWLEVRDDEIVISDFLKETIKNTEDDKVRTEELLKNFLDIDTRKDYREFNKGNIKEINLNDRTDLAYIRCEFKRWLLNNKPTRLKLYTDYSSGYSIITEDDNLDFTTLKDRNKVIERINLALTEINANNEKVFGLR